MIAIVATRREEVSTLLKSYQWERVPARGDALAYRRPQDGSMLVVSGAGTRRMELAVRWLLDTERPGAVMAMGLSGACVDALDTGDLVLATRLHCLDGAPFDWQPGSLDAGVDTDRRLLEAARDAVEVIGLDFVTGPTVTTPVLVRTPGLARWLGNTYGVLAADRESHAAASAAQPYGVPFLSVRAIAWGVSRSLPRAGVTLPDTPAGGRMLPLLRYGMESPRGLFHLLRAVRTGRRALCTLAAAMLDQHAVSPEHLESRA